MATSVSVRVADLHETLVRYLVGEGLTGPDAGCVADYLVDTERSGVRTHGIAHLRSYVRLMRAGTITPRPELTVLSHTGSTLTLHGGNGLGQIVGTWMMRLAAEQVRQSGAAVVTVRGANHLGALGYYFRLPGLERMGGLLTQVTAPMMLSPGAVEPRLGNNPFALGLPGSHGRPDLVLDISSSQTARSRIRQALRRGEDTPVPPDWALRADGTPARTAAEAWAGSLLPMAGHKGAGLATVMGALAGVVSGGAFGGDVTFPDDAVEPRNVGYFLVLFDVSALMDFDEYADRMDSYLGYLAGARTTDGQPVRLPGEHSAANRAATTERVELVPHQWDDLVAQLEAAGVPVPATS
ncbi:MAG TPA: Ldh family oxidoreductase [Rugosimonospora sp.]|nr:Ldh family oxidoreductase [Rugosimonospora sp.]